MLSVNRDGQIAKLELDTENSVEFDQLLKRLWVSMGFSTASLYLSDGSLQF